MHAPFHLLLTKLFCYFINMVETSQLSFSMVTSDCVGTVTYAALEVMLSTTCVSYRGNYFQKSSDKCQTTVIFQFIFKDFKLERMQLL